MAKVFRAWDVEQTWLLPPSIHELVPVEHPAHFIRELVRTELDLSAIYAAYDEERGFPRCCSTRIPRACSRRARSRVRARSGST